MCQCYFLNIFLVFLFNYVYHKSKNFQFVLHKIIMLISNVNAFIYFVLHGEVVFFTQSCPLFKSRRLHIRMKNGGKYISFRS